VKSISDVIKLEDSQGDASPARTPRSDAELKAQAYLLANCAHCHNQNGFPSVSNPELATVFNLYPGKRAAETIVGGIFQFPLETFSPRIKRVVANSNEDTKIAYITPSLRDIEGRGDTEDVPKFFDDLNPDPNSTASSRHFLEVPWRSLIYRNVYTPFSYSDARIVYPHMPFDTAGHDCRAAQWLGEWMVSIPAVRKHPDIPESCVDVSCQDSEPQPYVEVLPSDPGYAAALSAAKKRLATFIKDPENQHCVDNSEIVDSDVVPYGPFSKPRDKTRDGVPDHAHWVVTDLTERAGLWTPRRDDWKKVLIDHEYPPLTTAAGSGIDAAGALEAQKAVVAQLGTKHLSDVKAFASAKFPLTLWQSKANCNLAAERTVKSYAANERPTWFNKANPDPEARVFQVHPGQAVFDMICINCHGPNADSLGRQADLLQTVTGGRSRVANFRSGLFNPTAQDDPYDMPDLGLQVNRPRVFGPYASADVSTDDWGARYLAWMALGGTAAEIPQLVLTQVAVTGDAGLARPVVLTAKGANMLQVAQGACFAVQGYSTDGSSLEFDFLTREISKNPLIPQNGDRELWQRACALANPFIVRAIVPRISDGNLMPDGAISAYATTVCDSQGQPAGCYPIAAPVGDQHGETVAGLDPTTNSFAWCVSRGFGSISDEKLQAFAQTYLLNGKPLAICPASWETANTTVDHLAASKVWADRGAINAGFLVFDFLDKFIKGEMGHVQYNQCELLTSH
jgi:mono/diheme cytochrome c family protein